METEKAVTDKLRTLAQRLANEHQEPCLIVLDPPPSPVQKTESVIPYVVLLSQSCQEERRAAVQTIYPEADEPKYVKELK
jgi:hypothetical protein